MHVTQNTLGTVLHLVVANMPFYSIIVEVPKGHVEGSNFDVSGNMVCDTFLLDGGNRSDVTGVVDGLRNMH